MDSTIICKVKNCRFNKFHLTQRHQCGTCMELGHGQIECKNDLLKLNLTEFDSDILDINLYCTITDCVDPHTHLTTGHSCRFCFERVLHKKKCPLNLSENNQISDKLSDYMINIDLDMICSKYNLQIGECIRLFGGMGSSWYIRINKDTCIIEFIMMHSDSWGQYGADTSDLYRLNAFIYDYKIRCIDDCIEL
jgi:hypothetical protein